MTIDGPWIQAETTPRKETGATYLKLIFGDPNGVTSIYDVDLKRWFASSYPPNREGQLIANSPLTGSGYITVGAYVAVSVDGVLEWKKCAVSLTYLDTQTGGKPDELRPLYTFS